MVHTIVDKAKVLGLLRLWELSDKSNFLFFLSLLTCKQLVGLCFFDFFEGLEVGGQVVTASPLGLITPSF